MLPTATQSRIHSPGLKLTNALKCSIKWLSRLWKKTWISWHAEWRYVFSCELLPYAGAGNWAAETLQKRNLFFVLMYLGQSRNKENLPDRIIGIWKCWFFGVNRNTRRKIFWSKEKTKNKLKPHAYDADGIDMIRKDYTLWSLLCVINYEFHTQFLDYFVDFPGLLWRSKRTSEESSLYWNIVETSGDNAEKMWDWVLLWRQV